MAGLYLLINVGVIAIPLAYSWHPKLRFVDQWSAFARACLIVLAGFVIWDVVFTAMGIWGFDDRFLLGPRIAGLPIEEWLFFVCIPYACVFTYHSLKALSIGHLASGLTRCLSVLVFALCVILAVVFSSRLYTATTSALVALFLGVALFKKPDWMGRLWISFIVLVIPFVVSNGILTGIQFWNFPIVNFAPDAVSNHVVWYNNSHNLSVRLFSIPIDDFLYAFLLIGLNVTLFEYFRRRKERV